MTDAVPFIFIGICFFLWCCLYIPILCVNLRKYRQNQQNIVYLLRYVSILIVDNVLNISTLFVAMEWNL